MWRLEIRPLRYFFARELIALARELPGGKRELVEMASLSALAARAPCRRLRSTYHATPSTSSPLLVCDPTISYVSYLRKTIPVGPLPFDTLTKRLEFYSSFILVSAELSQRPIYKYN